MSKHSDKTAGGGNTPPATDAPPLAPGDEAPPPVLFLCRDQKPLRLTARHKKGTISATFRPKGRRLLLPHAAASTFAGALGALVKAGRLLRVHAKEEA